MSRGSQAVPRLRQLTPPASLLLVAAAGGWAGVVLVARHMGSMPGTWAWAPVRSPQSGR